MWVINMNLIVLVLVLNDVSYQQSFFQKTNWHVCLVYTGVTGKGKVLLRTGHEGPEGKQLYSSTLP